ncbi:MAG TPA: FtsW/RodA/SpoVE family cell cycle protein [Ferruginibacter sp.]|nr:FtsW/RodA/SpoVE family cell cycle protein [Ferruginibacter sp.]
MSTFVKWYSSRKLERSCLLLIAIIMGLLFWKLFSVLQRDFAEVNTRMENGTMINLNDNRSYENMKRLLERGLYFEDPKDISFIASTVAAAKDTNSMMANVGELNKAALFVNADEAFLKGGKSFKKRVMLSRNLLGFSGPDSITFEKERSRPLNVNATTNAGLGDHNISGIIKNKDGKPIAGALVRLKGLALQDSTMSSDQSEDQKSTVQFKDGVRKIFVPDSAKSRRLLSFNVYARTDATGKFIFSGLPANRSYEVLPLQPGYEFGRSLGVENLNANANFSFVQAPHLMRLFSAKDFNSFKKEKAFVVRTPDEVKGWFWMIIAIFFSSFFLLHIILSIRFPAADQLLMPVIMILTGLSFITLFSLQDPLRDRFLARSSFIYFCTGMAGIMIMQFINVRKLTTDSGFFRFFVFKNDRKASNGWPWALGAIALLCLTILFGTGPEGSGVKVNLFGFQPSEIVKYMVIFFLAGFFATNEKFISEYTSWIKRLSFFMIAVLAIVTTILLFLVLGDLGPAIVCCFTFIILFSFSRGDFPHVVAAMVLYAIALWIFNDVLTATAVAVGTLVLYMFISKRKLSESAAMALVVVSGFLLLDKIQWLSKIIPGPIQRLIDRKAIWADAWNNQVYGGDQVANGIWAISSGGITGQGAGEGFAKTIPEAHTDMILPAIGEEFGWAGMTCVFILFLLYLHRSIIIGRQTGTPFLFYLCAGIGIGTFVQFLLIAGGSTGALPLSGVALPFISYGGTSLLCSMLAAGFLLSTSRWSGSQAQMKYLTGRQDKNLMPALLAACVAIVLLMVNVSGYTFQNKKWIVEPALVADRSGARMYSYNPRINILMNRLQAGNVYDRNGKLLATSDSKLVQEQKDSLLLLGISASDVTSLAYKRADRYYPFGAHMFFWTGDANTGIFSGGTNGYFADYAHASELRGFPTPDIKYQVSANRYRPEKFLPMTNTEMTVTKRDYSALSHLLLAGINSDEVVQFKKQNRDITLTMDAALQTKIQLALQGDDSLNKKRISVVIMEDNTGDVITSASWPLAPVNDWERMNLSENELNKLPGWNVNSDIGFTHATQPGSTAKLVTSLAAFNKLGESAAKKLIKVYPKDLIRLTGPEPDEAGLISIERAIVRSNNSFFIRLANEEKLQEEMATLYMQSGMFLHKVGGYYFENETGNNKQQEKWRELWRKTEFNSLRRYNPNNIRRTRAIGISGMAWGQGELVATPAAVARVASGIANNGLMIPNRFVVSVNGVAASSKPAVKITNDESYAQQLAEFMKKQSAPKKGRLGILVAGKTGTPERIFRGDQINDGWYVFFAPKATGEGHIVVCIRIEAARGSSDAVKLAGKHIIPLLLERNYIKGFDPVEEKPVPLTGNKLLGSL